MMGVLESLSPLERGAVPGVVAGPHRQDTGEGWRSWGKPRPHPLNAEVPGSTRGTGHLD